MDDAEYLKGSWGYSTDGLSFTLDFETYEDAFNTAILEYDGRDITIAKCLPDKLNFTFLDQDNFDNYDLTPTILLDYFIDANIDIDFTGDLFEECIPDNELLEADISTYEKCLKAIEDFIDRIGGLKNHRTITTINEVIIYKQDIVLFNIKPFIRTYDIIYSYVTKKDEKLFTCKMFTPWPDDAFYQDYDYLMINGYLCELINNDTILLGSGAE